MSGLTVGHPGLCSSRWELEKIVKAAEWLMLTYVWKALINIEVGFKANF
jgi:hypothetical protein